MEDWNLLGGNFMDECSNVSACVTEELYDQICSGGEARCAGGYNRVFDMVVLIPFDLNGDLWVHGLPALRWLCGDEQEGEAQVKQEEKMERQFERKVESASAFAWFGFHGPLLGSWWNRCSTSW